MHKELQNKKIEETLNSLEGLRKAEANPFIYAKILVKMDSIKAKPYIVKQNVFILRFAVVLIAALTLNVFTYFTYSKYDTSETTNTNSREENLKSFAKEYSITGSIYNY